MQHLSALNEFAMYLMHLHTGFTHQILAYFFQISEAQLSTLLHNKAIICAAFWTVYYVRPRSGEEVFRQHTHEWLHRESWPQGSQFFFRTMLSFVARALVTSICKACSTPRSMPTRTP